MVTQFLWPVELKCLSTGEPGLLLRILRQCSLNPSGFTNIKNGRTSMTGHAYVRLLDWQVKWPWVEVLLQ